MQNITLFCHWEEKNHSTQSSVKMMKSLLFFFPLLIVLAHSEYSFLDSELNYLAYDGDWNPINNTDGSCGSFLACNQDFCGIIQDHPSELEMICITIEEDQCSLINDEEVGSLVDIAATGSSLGLSILFNIGLVAKIYMDKKKSSTK